jgi:hypothetical protein
VPNYYQNVDLVIKEQRAAAEIIMHYVYPKLYSVFVGEASIEGSLLPASTLLRDQLKQCHGQQSINSRQGEKNATIRSIPMIAVNVSISVMLMLYCRFSSFWAVDRQISLLIELNRCRHPAWWKWCRFCSNSNCHNHHSSNSSSIRWSWAPAWCTFARWRRSSDNLWLAISKARWSSQMHWQNR